jgi:hypothetical protein
MERAGRQTKFFHFLFAASVVAVAVVEVERDDRSLAPRWLAALSPGLWLPARLALMATFPNLPTVLKAPQFLDSSGVQA